MVIELMSAPAIDTCLEDGEQQTKEDEVILERYAEALESHFPRAVPDEVLIKQVTKVLGKHGFNPDTSINLVSTCRDEICRPFTEQLDRVWGNSFNISSLAGFCFCGRTGFKAAMAHAPIVDGMERYVFWVAPHIGLTLEGEVGKVYRPGREAPSSACGAMIAVHNELKSGRLNVSLDPIDIEQSLLKQKLISSLHYGQIPSLVELTFQAYETILAEVQKLAAASTDSLKCEYVIIGGVQVHGPLGQNFFWPGDRAHYFDLMCQIANDVRFARAALGAGKMTKFVGGVETDLYEEYAASVASTSPGDKMVSSSELQAWCLNTALANLQLQRRKVRLAAVQGNVAELKRAGINLPAVTDNQRRSLLHIAAMNGQEGVARMLLQLDASLVESMDLAHMTAIDYAFHAGHDAVADLLHAHNAGLDGDRLRDQLVQAVEAVEPGRLARLIKYARRAAEAVGQATDKDGRSLMHICLSAKAVGAQSRGGSRDEIFQLLLENSAVDMAAEIDFFGNNLLTEAQRAGDDKVTGLLHAAASRRRTSFTTTGAAAGPAAAPESPTLGSTSAPAALDRRAAAASAAPVGPTEPASPTTAAAEDQAVVREPAAAAPTKHTLATDRR